MKEGKLNWDDLKQIIEKNRSVDRKEVKVKSGVGEDCSIVNFGEEDCVLSTDPITGSGSNVGRLAVHINCNDIASSGVEPIGILVTILAPEGSTIEEIDRVMKEISEEAKKLNVEILGGHTEVTSAVNRLIVSCTAVGKGKSKNTVSTHGAEIDDDIIVTKKLCLEGTSIIINDHYEKLKEILTHNEIEEGKNYINQLSVVKEGKIAGDFGVNSMHDITEGGVLGALWEIAEAGKIGFKVYKDEMPISELSKKVCDYFNIDPLRLISSGSMAIICSNGKKLIEKLKMEGINAAIIGKITDSKGIVVENGREEEVMPPDRDELFKI